MMRGLSAMAAVLVAAGASGAAPAAKDDFLGSQAFDEMQRVSGQVDVIQTNLDDLSARVGRLESAKGGADSLRAEIDGLHSRIEELRAEMQAMRKGIVDELTKKILKLQQPGPRPTPAPAAATAEKNYDGPLSEYVVQSGDSLYLIARAFNTSVAKVKAINGLKSDALKIGQKIMVPANGGNRK